MNFQALEDAIFAWVQGASGLDDQHIAVMNEDGVAPAPGPGIVISLGGPRQAGQFARAHDFSANRPNGQEIVRRFYGHTHLTVSLECFSPKTTEGGTNPSARQMLTNVQTALALPSVRDALNKVGIGIVDRGEVRWLPGIQKAGWEGRAFLEVLCLVPETATDSIGYIAKVNGVGTVSDGPPIPYTTDVEE